MIDFGTVKPGRTLYVPFDSFAGSTGASVTLTGLATSDILVYKDGSTTQRSSTSGFTLLDTDGIDFDGLTGIHGFSISLADNSDAGFYAAGSRYIVVVSSVTVDSQTVSFVACTFSIGQPDAVLNTTIATLSSQTSFTLTVGPAEDDALNDCWLMIHDVASAVQMAVGIVSDYTGSTKTVTLAAAPTFTIAATDNIAVMGPMPMQPTVAARKPVVDAAGLVDANVVKVGPTGSGTAQTARDIGASVLLSSGTGTGQLDFTSGVVKANLAQILGTALTETAGQIAAAFKKFFDIASPTSTMNRITLVDTTTTNTDMRGTDNAATAAEMAKVPKSDSNVTWNATALASINAEADTALADAGVTTTVTGRIDAAISSRSSHAASDVTGGTTVAAAVTSIKGADGDTLKTLSDQLDGKSTFNPTADEVESGVNWKQALQRIGATTAGECSGAGSGTETFKGLDGTTDRVEATVDNDGNRTGVTYDP